MEKLLNQGFSKKIRELKEQIFHIALHYESLKLRREKDYKEGKLSQADYEMLKLFSITDCYCTHLEAYCLSEEERMILKKYALIFPNGELSAQLVRDELITKEKALNKIFNSIIIGFVAYHIEEKELKSFLLETLDNSSNTIMEKWKNIPETEQREKYTDLLKNRERGKVYLENCSLDEARSFLFKLKRVDISYYQYFANLEKQKEDSTLSAQITQKNKESRISKEEFDFFLAQINKYINLSLNEKGKGNREIYRKRRAHSKAA